MSPFIGELLGTMLLIVLGAGVVANVVLRQTKGHQSGWIVITAGWAMAVFIGVAVAQPFSGAHLNPAVSLGLALAGKMPWAEMPLYLAGQALGAALGSALVWLAYQRHFESTEDRDAKLGVFCTIPAIRSPFANLMTETIGTFVLILAALVMTAPELSLGTEAPARFGLGALGALPSALLVFAIGLSLGGPTGYAINPFRDLIPRLMHAILPIPGKRDSDWGYAWVPIAGPLLGSVLAAALYLSVN